MTNLPIQADLRTHLGSAQTASLLVLLGFYAYVWMRRVPRSAFAVIATLLALAALSDVPDLAASLGFMRWMYALTAWLVCSSVCLRHPQSDGTWLGWTVVGAITILMAGHAYDQGIDALIFAATYGVLALMVIGACFDTELATVLRNVAAAMLVTASLGLVLWHVNKTPGAISFAALTGLLVLSVVYMQWIRRLGWFYVAGFQASCLIGLAGWSSYESGSLSQTSWPIPSGVLCFVIGLTITSVKTGVHRRLRCPDSPRLTLRHYQSGL